VLVDGGEHRVDAPGELLAAEDERERGLDAVGRAGGELRGQERLLEAVELGVAVDAGVAATGEVRGIEQPGHAVVVLDPGVEPGAEPGLP
jgi:hypothetical protein